MDRTATRAHRRQRWVQRAEKVRDAFGLVLVLVLATYVLTSLLSNRGWPAVVLTVATSVTSVVALTSSHANPRLVRSAIWLSGLTIVLAAMAAVLRRVVTTAEVGSRTILGAISVYTVLGILFTFIYGTVDRIQGSPFFEGVAHPSGSDLLFFSYTTLTTTGYGNLVPGGQPGRMLAGLEMMIGQIFLVTLVAGLVSLWRPGEALRRRQEKHAQT
jgi:hypothetical protein